MGASKLAQINTHFIELGLLTRAIGHPTRLKIYQLVKEHGVVRNTDLSDVLELSRSSVHSHLLKMKDAGIVHFDFYPNCYLIRLDEERMTPLLEFLKH